jgi:hypothetical protein
MCPFFSAVDFFFNYILKKIARAWWPANHWWLRPLQWLLGLFGSHAVVVKAFQQRCGGRQDH